MRTGFNDNVESEGRTYHVQTEDVSDRDEIVSQVFLEGQVMHTYRVSYAEWKGETGWEQRVADQARRQHTLMVAAAMRGRVAPKSEGS
jgi:hypothetical protein